MSLPEAPVMTGEFEADVAVCGRAWTAVAAELAKLPAKPQRSPEQAAAVAATLSHGRLLRERFLRVHADGLYDRLTLNKTQYLRLDALAYAAAELVPGLVPTRAQVVAEAALPQKDKDGAEVDQGLLLAHVLALPGPGRHLCQAMLLPRPESASLLQTLQHDGAVELGTASIRREGRAVVVEARNPRFLNAEDEATLDEFEVAVDVAIMDP